MPNTWSRLGFSLGFMSGFRGRLGFGVCLRDTQEATLAHVRFVRVNLGQGSGLRLQGLGFQDFGVQGQG